MAWTLPLVPIESKNRSPCQRPEYVFFCFLFKGLSAQDSNILLVELAQYIFVPKELIFVVP